MAYKHATSISRVKVRPKHWDLPIILHDEKSGSCCKRLLILTVLDLSLCIVLLVAFDPQNDICHQSNEHRMNAVIIASGFH
jgi:hypothetical protein